MTLPLHYAPVSQGRRVGDPNLDLLMRLPGLRACFDSSWNLGLRLRHSGGKDFVTMLLDRTRRHWIVQPTENRQPVLMGRTPSGKMTITFGEAATADGVGDILWSGFGSNLASYVSGGQSYTAYAHFSTFSSTGNRSPFAFGRVDVGEDRRITHQYNADRRIQVSRVDSGGTTTNSAAVDTVIDGEHGVYSFVHHSGANTAWKNKGAALGGINVASNTREPIVDAFSIGGIVANGSPALFHQGTISSVIICSGEHTADVRAAAISALIARYGIGA